MSFYVQHLATELSARYLLWSIYFSSRQVSSFCNTSYLFHIVDDEREPSIIDKTPGELETKIAELIQTHDNEIESLKTEHSTVLQTIDSKHLAELSQVKSELETQRESHKSDLESIRETQKCELESVKEKHAADQENLQKTHKAEFEQLIESHKKTTAELDETSKQQLYISQQYERKVQCMRIQSNGGQAQKITWFSLMIGPSLR